MGGAKSRGGLGPSGRTERGWAFVLWALVGVSSSAWASSQPAVPRLSSAPRIDGQLDDAAWQEAVLFDGFVQASPAAGESPTQKTEVRIGHDGQRLYIAVRAFERSPARIVAQQMRRDVEALDYDDHVLVVLDVEGQARNGFILLVNPNGTQRDSLVYDGLRVRHDWDALWQSEARVDDQGWSAEIEIPLAALGVRQGAPALWRINAERWMSAEQQRVRLAHAGGDKEVSALSEALPLGGARVEAGGWGLRVKPSLRLTHHDAGGLRRTRAEPGLELFHQGEGGLRTTAALNLDFGEAEADERVVNLTRFPLFVAEKREFFLQDAGRFSFGGLSESTLPFFSRRVGVGEQGQALDLEAGLKLAGTAAGIEFGALGAQVAAGDEPGQRRARVGVVRAARGVGENGRLGVIATTGNPQGTGGSHLWGVDGQWRDTRLFGSRTLELNVWLQQSANEGLGTGRAVGMSLDYPNEGLTGSLAVQRVDETFSPALGFLEEAGVSRAEGFVGWWHLPSSGGHVVPGMDVELRRRLDGSERSVLFNPEVELENAAGDLLLPEIYLERDRLATAYEPVPGVLLSPGEHRWTYFSLLAETSPARSVSATAEGRHGGFYDGKRREATGTLTWRPSRHWAIKGGAGRNAIEAGGGRFVVRTRLLRLDHTPSNRLTASALLQWDNVSRELGAVLRLRWAWAPRREWLVAVDHLRTDADTGLPRERRTAATLKWLWNFDV